MSNQDELPEPSAPESISVSARGFTTTTEAENFAHCIAGTVREISRYINLSRLDGITVAFDYDQALAELDRGCQTTRPLTRTSDNRVLGIAMAPAVLRDGVVKGHSVFYAPRVLPIQDGNDRDFALALYLIAHECAHVEELLRCDERFPGMVLQAVATNCEDALLGPITEAIWSEYAACRRSAIFGKEESSAYPDCLVGALTAARDEANIAIQEYRLHGDLNRVLKEAGRPLCEPLRFAAYLIGHLDGRKEDWGTVPAARDRLAESEYAPSIERLTEALRKLWDTTASWDTLAVFDPLKENARDVLKEGGMIVTRQHDGSLYVDIPFTEATMPMWTPNFR